VRASPSLSLAPAQQQTACLQPTTLLLSSSTWHCVVTCWLFLSTNACDKTITHDHTSDRAVYTWLFLVFLWACAGITYTTTDEELVFAAGSSYRACGSQTLAQAPGALSIVIGAWTACMRATSDALSVGQNQAGSRPSVLIVVMSERWTAAGLGVGVAIVLCARHTLHATAWFAG
jgi:hypothetical protein